ncbi:hypothetical protein JOD89_005823 [Priestia megaterium]|uniref:hypothetical protein n=1 Tax=Priestia megaterium TaxID=1404 RepID=UPI003D1B1E44
MTISNYGDITEDCLQDRLETSGTKPPITLNTHVENLEKIEHIQPVLSQIANTIDPKLDPNKFKIDFTLRIKVGQPNPMDMPSMSSTPNLGRSSE